MTAGASSAMSQPLDVGIDAPPALAPLAARIEAMNPEAMARALAMAGLDLPPAIHVTLIAEGERRAAQTPRWVVAQAFGIDRIVIYPSRISAYPYESLEGVVLHEVAHLALERAAEGGSLPRWFHEGVAVSVESGWGLGSQLRLLLATVRGPLVDDVDRLFASGSQPETATAYMLAAALVDDVRRRHGRAVPGAIARRVARGTGFDRAFWIETGDTVDEAAARAWSAYRGWRHWLPALVSPAALWSWILGLAFVAFAVRVYRRRRRRRMWTEEADADEEDVDTCV